MTFSEKNIQEGVFKNGKPNGQNKITNLYGLIYEGDFQDGSLIG